MGNWSAKEVALPAIEFDGDSVAFTVKRLRVEDMVTLSQFYDRAAGSLKFASHMEVCQAAASVLPKYVTAMDGLKTADGAEVGLAQFTSELVHEFYFVPLVGQLLGELVRVSVVGGDEKK